MAEATNFCRDLANEPSNYLTPTEMADQAQAMADKTGLECEIYGPDWMREKGMGGLLGVAKGSAEEPRFIVLRYNGAGEAQPRRARRQGHHLRHRRHLDQARRRTWAR